MKILVINAGSSSLKYQLIDMDSREVLSKGNCERIGTGGTITHKSSHSVYKTDIPLADHYEALRSVVELLTSHEYGVISSLEEVDAVGHRVAHGGERYKSSCIVDDEMLSYLEEIIPINPLHGPAAIEGIRGCMRLLPNTKQVAVFDTSFYSDIEEHRYIYPIPYEFYNDDKIRKYGFHGTSHRYVSALAAEMLGKSVGELKIVTCHLGNGSSVTAIDNGRAIDTSMGFTPQDGIPMGTRSGALDPSVIPYIMRLKNLSVNDVETLINRKSGLLGVSGISNDIRNVEEEAFVNNNDRAMLSLKILYNCIKRYIGSYVAELNGLDVLVFTGGIGENDPELREAVCDNMDYIGISIDSEKNYSVKRGFSSDISSDSAKVKTLVIPTDEEMMIAMDTLSLIS